MLMPFGKYKHAPVDELPDTYLLWLLGLENLKEPLLSHVREEIGARGLQQQAPERHNRPDTLQTAKQVHKRLSLKYHPDRAGNTGIQQGLNIFFDELKKALHLLLKHWIFIKAQGRMGTQ